MIDTDLLRIGASSFNLSLTDGQLAQFDRYAEALTEANRHVNLTAIIDPEEIVYKHFLDSLSVFSACMPADGAKWLDVGTGAGFPGAALLIARPDLCMTLLDGTQKKLEFIRRTLDSLQLSAQTLHARAEESGQDPAHREQYAYVSARAVAALPKLAEYCLPFLRVGGVFIAMKSQNTDGEIRDAAQALRILGGKIESVHSVSLPHADARTLICIKKISHTPAKYPRPAAKIAKQTL